MPDSRRPSVRRPRGPRSRNRPADPGARMHRLRPLTVLLLGLCAAGCSSDRPSAPVETVGVGAMPAPVAVQPTALADVAPSLPPVKALPGIENYRRLSAKIAQGGQPNEPASFAALKAEGITTILSVDGSTPNVEGAKAAGLKYVHVP